MNTFQLKCFLAVANTLSFVRASEIMKVSQPTITNQIKALEEELNVKLFRRSSRFVEITAEGTEFISDAKSIVGISAQAKLRFNSSAEKTTEVISIGCSNYIVLGLLTDVLYQLNKEIPNIHPRLFVFPHEKLFHLLGSERLDVIFDIYDDTYIKDDIKYKELVQSNMVCLCRTDHKLSDKETVTMQDLSEENLIFCDPMTLAPNIAKFQFQLAEGRCPADIHFCTSPEASYVLAASGIGVSLLPELMTHSNSEIAKKQLIDAPKLSCGLFHKPSLGDTTVKTFIRLAKEHFDQTYAI